MELIHVRRATYYSTRSASATAQEAERSDVGALGSEQASERSVIRRLLRTEAVAQRNSGVHRSQSRLEAIVTDVLYGTLGAFHGLAGLI
jgi:hypothetical protein